MREYLEAGPWEPVAEMWQNVLPGTGLRAALRGLSLVLQLSSFT